ncbi:hypothetical protein GGR58DRAFT_29811 [Xylaria digitata]|nr:hypothetical protein GGR58DRAFT_29811 [Xylaria digitata]
MQLSQHLHSLGATLPLVMSVALGELAPWSVTSLQSWQPSGRPGSNPDWYIHVNITNPDPTQSELDPNILEGNVYCQIVWLYPDVPYNQIVPCEIVDTTSPTAWAWTVELLEADDDNPYPTSNFDLRWRAASTVSGSTEGDVQVWTGIGQFEWGKNLQGTCAASGFCSFWLKEESTPVSIEVSSLSCSGTVDEALRGLNCDQESQ